MERIVENIGDNQVKLEAIRNSNQSSDLLKSSLGEAKCVYLDKANSVKRLLKAFNLVYKNSLDFRDAKILEVDLKFRELAQRGLELKNKSGNVDVQDVASIQALKIELEGKLDEVLKDLPIFVEVEKGFELSRKVEGEMDKCFNDAHFSNLEVSLVNLKKFGGMLEAEKERISKFGGGALLIKFLNDLKEVLDVGLKRGSEYVLSLEKVLAEKVKMEGVMKKVDDLVGRIGKGVNEGLVEEYNLLLGFVKKLKFDGNGVLDVEKWNEYSEQRYLKVFSDKLNDKNLVEKLEKFKKEKVNKQFEKIDFPVMSGVFECMDNVLKKMKSGEEMNEGEKLGYEASFVRAALIWEKYGRQYWQEINHSLEEQNKMRYFEVKEKILGLVREFRDLRIQDGVKKLSGEVIDGVQIWEMVKILPKAEWWKLDRKWELNEIGWKFFNGLDDVGKRNFQIKVSFYIDKKLTEVLETEGVEYNKLKAKEALGRPDLVSKLPEMFGEKIRTFLEAMKLQGEGKLDLAKLKYRDYLESLDSEEKKSQEYYVWMAKERIEMMANENYLKYLEVLGNFNDGKMEGIEKKLVQVVLGFKKMESEGKNNFVNERVNMEVILMKINANKIKLLEGIWNDLKRFKELEIRRGTASLDKEKQAKMVVELNGEDIKMMERRIEVLKNGLNDGSILDFDEEVKSIKSEYSKMLEKNDVDRKLHPEMYVGVKEGEVRFDERFLPSVLLNLFEGVSRGVLNVKERKEGFLKVAKFFSEKQVGMSYTQKYLDMALEKDYEEAEKTEEVKKIREKIEREMFNDTALVLKISTEAKRLADTSSEEGIDVFEKILFQRQLNIRVRREIRKRMTDSGKADVDPALKLYNWSLPYDAGKATWYTPWRYDEDNWNDYKEKSLKFLVETIATLPVGMGAGIAAKFATRGLLKVLVNGGVSKGVIEAIEIGGVRALSNWKIFGQLPIEVRVELMQAFGVLGETSVKMAGRAAWGVGVIAEGATLAVGNEMVNGFISGEMPKFFTMIDKGDFKGLSKTVMESSVKVLMFRAMNLGVMNMFKNSMESENFKELVSDVFTGVGGTGVEQFFHVFKAMKDGKTFAEAMKSGMGMDDMVKSIFQNILQSRGMKIGRGMVRYDQSKVENLQKKMLAEEIGIKDLNNPGRDIKEVGFNKETREYVINGRKISAKELVLMGNEVLREVYGRLEGGGPAERGPRGETKEGVDNEIVNSVKDMIESVFKESREVDVKINEDGKPVIEGRVVDWEVLRQALDGLRLNRKNHVDGVFGLLIEKWIEKVLGIKLDVQGGMSMLVGKLNSDLSRVKGGGEVPQVVRDELLSTLSNGSTVELNLARLQVIKNWMEENLPNVEIDYPKLIKGLKTVEVNFEDMSMLLVINGVKVSPLVMEYILSSFGPSMNAKFNEVYIDGLYKKYGEKFGKWFVEQGIFMDFFPKHTIEDVLGKSISKISRLEDAFRKIKENGGPDYFKEPPVVIDESGIVIKNLMQFEDELLNMVTDKKMSGLKENDWEEFYKILGENVVSVMPDILILRENGGSDFLGKVIIDPSTGKPFNDSFVLKKYLKEQILKLDKEKVAENSSEVKVKAVEAKVAGEGKFVGAHKSDVPALNDFIANLPKDLSRQERYRKVAVEALRLASIRLKEVSPLVKNIIEQMRNDFDAGNFKTIDYYLNYLDSNSVFRERLTIEEKVKFFSDVLFFHEQTKLIDDLVKKFPNDKELLKYIFDGKEPDGEVVVHKRMGMLAFEFFSSKDYEKFGGSEGSWGVSLPDKKKGLNGVLVLVRHVYGDNKFVKDTLDHEWQHNLDRRVFFGSWESIAWKDAQNSIDKLHFLYGRQKLDKADFDTEYMREDLDRFDRSMDNLQKSFLNLGKTEILARLREGKSKEQAIKELTKSYDYWKDSEKNLFGVKNFEGAMKGYLVETFGGRRENYFKKLDKMIDIAYRVQDINLLAITPVEKWEMLFGGK